MRRAALLDAACALTIGLFGAMLSLAFFMPVYYDDARYAISHWRAGVDGWAALSATPYCTASFLVPYPAGFLPGRWLAWVVQGQLGDPLQVRAHALAVFLLWAGYLCWVLKRCLMPGWRWLWCAACVAASCAVGTAPFLLLQGRPDVGMLLVVTVFATLPLVLAGRVLPRWGQLLLAAGLLLAVSWYFSAHAKALLYTPLLLVSFAFLPLGRRLKLAAVLLVALMATQGFVHWQARIYCPEDARAQAMRSMQAVSLSRIVHKVNANFDHFLEGHRELERALFAAAHGIGAKEVGAGQFLEYSSMLLAAALFYLVPLLLSIGLEAVYNIFYSYLYVQRMMLQGGRKWRLPLPESQEALVVNLMIGALALFACIQLVRALYWLLRSSRREHWRQVPQAMLFALAFSFLLQSGMQIAKNFYEVPFVWPCFVLLCILAAALPLWREALARYHARALGALLAVAIASQGVLLHGYVPLLREAYASADANGVMKESSVLVRPTGYAATAARVRTLAAQCGIAADATARRVLVDPLTYLAMKDTVQPLMFRQSYGEEAPDTLAQLLHMLRQRESRGAVMRCDLLPLPLRPLAVEDEGGLCCLTREAIAWAEP